MYTEYSADYDTFYRAAMADIERAKTTREYGLDSAHHPNWFDASFIPWISYDALHLELPDGHLFFNPIVNWGKYQEENGRIKIAGKRAAEPRCGRRLSGSQCFPADGKGNQYVMRRIIDSHAHIGRYGQLDCDPGLLLSQMDAAGIRVNMELRSDHSCAIQLISECSNLYGDTPFVSA